MVWTLFNCAKHAVGFRSETGICARLSRRILQKRQPRRGGDTKPLLVWAPSAAALHLVDREAVRWSRATRSLKNDERNFALNDGIVQLQWVSTVNRKHVVWCSTSKSNTDRVLRSHLDVVCSLLYKVALPSLVLVFFLLAEPPLIGWHAFVPRARPWLMILHWGLRNYFVLKKDLRKETPLDPDGNKFYYKVLA